MHDLTEIGSSSPPCLWLTRMYPVPDAGDLTYSFYLLSSLSRHDTASFCRALRVQMARDCDAIVVDHLGMGWAWPVVEAYRRQKAGVVLVFIAHQCEGEVRQSVARNFRGNIVRKIGLSVDAAG